MEQELYTIQLTRRELGLLKHYTRLLFTNIDDDVTTDGCLLYTSDAADE